MYQLKELVDVEAGERMLKSIAFQTKVKDEQQRSSIEATVLLAKSLGGYVPVRYFMNGAQEGLGRMKAQVMVEGMSPLPYVRMMRNARSVLAAKFYWDLDMVNCQPSLLAQTLVEYSIPCPLLQRYVNDRESCVREVMESCSVSRDESKRLLIRLLFFGGIKGWLDDHPHVNEASIPSWIPALRDELRTTSKALLKLPIPQLQHVKECQAKKTVCFSTYAPLECSTDPLASVMAVYLQTLECDCIRALIKAVQTNNRGLGGLIYDGVLVLKLVGETELPPSLLRKWEKDVADETRFKIKLAVKALEVDPEWLVAQSDDGDMSMLPWENGTHLMGYNEMKREWEKYNFKICNKSCFIHYDPITGKRDIKSEKVLMDSYGHMAYSNISVRDTGCVVANLRRPFLKEWVGDPTLRSYRDMVFMPPPLTACAGVFNTWDGFDVGNYDPSKPVDIGSDGVLFILDFVNILCGRNEACTKYLLDWIAQIFQQPGKKTGVAILLKGQEGVGKNRLTDLLRVMLGGGNGSTAKFLQTATPANTLYGRFTRQREGKVLIVINESNGSDNFAAMDIIKDMITCDEFQSEGKGTNAYTMNCVARFMFTTNNDNCLKVNPDSRRYVVIEVSSELKGNTEYFNKLSALIDDEHTRFEFYRHLMSRDLNGIDWINHRPVTEYLLDMIAINLPYELQFLKQLVIEQYQKMKEGIVPEGGVVRFRSVKLFNMFCDEFLRSTFSNSNTYNTTDRKFGRKLASVVWSDTRKDGFRGLMHTHSNGGTVYTFDIAKLAREMVEKRWAKRDEVGLVSWTE